MRLRLITFESIRKKISSLDKSGLFGILTRILIYYFFCGEATFNEEDN